MLRRTTLAGLIASLCAAAHSQIYVSTTGNNTTGDSWVNAFTTVAAGVAAAGSGQEIWIAAGTYNISAMISIPSNRSVYGGFPATGNPGFGDRDAAANPTTLDGLSTYHIFECSGATGVIIDGLGFTHALGSGSAGGAIRVVSSADVDINDCKFFNNGAVSYGGGVYIESAHADISGCDFSNNSANEAGALMSFNGTANVSDSRFFGNEGSQGGAILVYGQPMSITRCVFYTNAGDRGGAVAMRENSGSSITNSLFVGNMASNHGGAINYESQLNFTVMNCTLVDNTAATRGGGIFVHDSGGTIANCVLVNNDRRAIYENNSSADPLVKNCLFYQNPDGVYYDEGTTSIAAAQGGSGLNALVAQATNNLDGDPQFYYSTAGDFHILTTSPTKNAGTSTGAPSDDFDGETRDVSIDIGFDEYLDTDSDGLPDYWEILHGLDPESSVGVNGAGGDGDGDGLTNSEEFTQRTAPDDNDTDDDGVNDGTEISLGTDPLDTDSDDDGIGDGAEISLGTDPLDSDSDDDGIGDGTEVGLGTDPSDGDSPGVAAWVEFAFAGSELGTYSNPYNTVADGLANTPSGELLGLKPGTTAETLVINQNVRIRSFGGTARIGD